MSTNALHAVYVAAAALIAVALFRRAFEFAIPAGYLLLVAICWIVPSDFQYAGAIIPIGAIILTLPWNVVVGALLNLVPHAADSALLANTGIVVSAIVNAAILVWLVRTVRSRGMS